MTSFLLTVAQKKTTYYRANRLHGVEQYIE
jgi:hypothetical protein